MTEQNLIQLGFKKNEVTAQESGSDYFYYYTFDIGSIALITKESTSVIADNWSVFLFDFLDVEIYDYDSVKTLIDIFIQNQIK